MAAISKREKIEKESLYCIGYEYLRKNFHKFNERNKIKVAISILSIFEKDDTKTKPETHTHITIQELKKLEMGDLVERARNFIPQRS